MGSSYTKFKYVIEYSKPAPSDPLGKGIKEARACAMTVIFKSLALTIKK